MATTLPLGHCKKVIALVWFVGAGLPFALLLVQSLIGFYGDSVGEVWRWFIGAVSPTLGLIVAVLAAEALQHEPGTRPVDSFFYRVAVGISVLYLLSILGLIVAVRLRDPVDGLPQLAREAAGWLTMLQGLVTAALGVFYVRKP